MFERTTESTYTEQLRETVMHPQLPKTLAELQDKEAHDAQSHRIADRAGTVERKELAWPRGGERKTSPRLNGCETTTSAGPDSNLLWGWSLNHEKTGPGFEIN